MKRIKPKRKSTVHSDDFREWVPSSFDSFLVELDHIINSCEGDDPAPLFRGQANYEWFLDSTFVRNSIRALFDLPDYYTLTKRIRRTVSFHRALVSLILLKFGTVGNPSKESFERERIEDIDPWFEWLKNLQQYPERDGFIKGTFLLDWSRSKEIAIYFATYSGIGETRGVSSNHGALWICDAAATGKTLQTKKLGEILSLMSGEEFLNGNRTLPLLFHPPKQTFQARSINQAPVYIAQMDFRYDLGDVWASYEERNEKRVFVKLILLENLKGNAARYLDSKNVTENSVYPE